MDCKCFNKVILPQRRCCGPEYKYDDAYYLKSTKAEARRLVNIGLTVNSSILDVGCGQGRLAIGLIESKRKIKYYRGVDVQQVSIDWCQKFITERDPTYQFTHLDVMNARYNRKGKSMEKDFRFPFKKGEFDIIYLFSVFTHMIAEDIRIYLKEFKRVLAPSGKIFLTAFIEKDVPYMTINPEGYLKKLGLKRWKGNLHCVLYDRVFFASMLTENGFKIDRAEKVNDCGQEGIYVSRKQQ